MCKWLLNPAKKIRRKPKSENRLPVDESKLNMENSYSSAPKYYYDIEFTCVDCGIEQNWTAKQQKLWYEEAGGYFFSTAIRCRTCRKNEKKRVEDARRTHQEGIKKNIQKEN